MKRFSWSDMQVYWKGHSARWSAIDVARDPDGLGNVCYVGAPLWLNRYYARFQRMVFEQLLRLVPPPAPGARALDVGCGAGRWCRLLAARGYAAVGIDLQPELIELNRRRDPHVMFACTSIQDYDAPSPFDLVTSVTVLQHIPFEQQVQAIRKIRALVKPRGHALLLENICDQGPHLFSRTIGDWQARFTESGFQCVALRRYDYSPLLRLCGWLSRWRGEGRHQTAENGDAVTPELFLEHLARPGGLRRLNHLVKCVAVIPDTVMETVLVQSNLSLPTVHCGMLFQANE